MTRPLLAAVAGVAVIALTGSCAPPENEGELRPNVLLITLDTTRADRFGSYGSTAGLTPSLDRLAETGVVFRRAIAQAAVTPVSHASILTGREPYHHGLRRMHGRSSNRLPPEEHTLAETLAGAGYSTAGFVSAFPVSEYFGFAQGFATFDARFDAGPDQLLLQEQGIVDTGQSQRRAEETTGLAVDWLRGAAAGPFFLWVHYFDPHDPYVVPPGMVLEEPRNAEEGRRALLEIYDAEIRYMDHHAGRLLAALEQNGVDERTIVVVVADHGEGLGDHDWWTHGILYQEQIHVPLIIRAPGIEGGRRVDALVRTVDLLPTVLQLTGVAPPRAANIDGVSLVPALQGTDPPPLVAYSDSMNTVTYQFVRDITETKDEVYFAIVDWPWKLILHVLAPEASELYDLEQDPVESRNLYAERPDQVERLREMLDAREPYFSTEGDETMSPEAVERLEALGYLR